MNYCCLEAICGWHGGNEVERRELMPDYILEIGKTGKIGLLGSMSEHLWVSGFCSWMMDDG